MSSMSSYVDRQLPLTAIMAFGRAAGAHGRIFNIWSLLSEVREEFEAGRLKARAQLFCLCQSAACNLNLSHCFERMCMRRVRPSGD